MDRLKSQSAVITASISSCENVTAKTPNIRQSKNGLPTPPRWFTQNTANHIELETRISAMTIKSIRQDRGDVGLGSIPQF